MGIRVALNDDIDELIRLDTIAPLDPSRADFIRRWVEAGDCYVAEEEGKIVGYGVLNYQFFHSGNVDMLMIHPDFRGLGIGRRLLQHVADRCTTGKLWVTTNLSNQRMQRLLTSTGFQLSGFIENLDEGDPELVFFKRIAISEE